MNELHETQDSVAGLDAVTSDTVPGMGEVNQANRNVERDAQFSNGFFARPGAHGEEISAWDPTRRMAGTSGTPVSAVNISSVQTASIDPERPLPPAAQWGEPRSVAASTTALGSPRSEVDASTSATGSATSTTTPSGMTSTPATSTTATSSMWGEQRSVGLSGGSSAFSDGQSRTDVFDASKATKDGVAIGWKKPALAGGLVGALMASAVLGTALVTTRRSQNRTESAIARTSAVGDRASDTTGNRASGTTSGTNGASSNSSPIFVNKNSIDIPGIVKSLEPSIVSISTKGFPSFQLGQTDVPEGAGSGVVLSKDGIILTNAHVIADASAIKVAMPGGKTYDADVIGRDVNNDVAVVKVRNVNNLVPAKLGKSKDLVVGEPVVAIGNALALSGSPTVTSGIISALNRDIESDAERLTGLLQTDAAINPGNSGGPLVNAKGEVVGMNTAIYRGSNNIGFAIAMDRIQPIVDRLRSGEPEKPRTFLGVTTQTMDAATQNLYSLGTDKGALVIEVTIGSPAENAGLQRGDIITKFDGKTIADNRELGEIVRKHKAGDEVSTSYMRGLQTFTTTVTLGAARRAQ